MHNIGISVRLPELDLLTSMVAQSALHICSDPGLTWSMLFTGWVALERPL